MYFRGLIKFLLRALSRALPATPPKIKYLPRVQYDLPNGNEGGFILWQREGGEARSSRSGVKRSGEYELGA